uniref:Uncharacterized protein n=1 Tax=Melopsittacus undulatus TaxID=13146 RepID=A0A8V5G6E3_MELUD
MQLQPLIFRALHDENVTLTITLLSPLGNRGTDRTTFNKETQSEPNLQNDQLSTNSENSLWFCQDLTSGLKLQKKGSFHAIHI